MRWSAEDFNAFITQHSVLTPSAGDDAREAAAA
jgi:hypothetical protein